MQLAHRQITGGRGDGPHLLVTGGVHGDEFEPMVAARRLVQAIDPAKLRGRVTLVPVVNEPAFVRRSRTAEDGLDLARTCPGRADGSITERIAHALSELIRATDFYIDLHTGGTTITLQPLVGYTLHADAAVLERQRAMARAFGLPIIWGTSPALEGRSLSVARDARVPAIYAEYGGGGRCDPAGVEAYVEGCLNVIGMLDMVDASAASAGPCEQAAPPIVVEDARIGSGHLQVCNPAPIAGCFLPHVQLGQRIAKGDPLGSVSDLLGERVETVCSDMSGMVIGLRTFPRIEQGESVAVVLEL